MWAIDPFDVGTDYAHVGSDYGKTKKAAHITTEPPPTSNRIRCPHPMELPAHIDRNTQLPATLWFLRRPTYRCCHNAEGCKEAGIQARGGRQTRCRVIQLRQISPKNSKSGHGDTHSVATCYGRGPGGDDAVSGKIENSS